MTASTVTMPIAGRGVILATCRLVCAFVWIIFGGGTCFILAKTGFRSSGMRLIVYRGLCKIFRIEVIVHGKPADTRPTLVASNHISYLDILAYGAVAELEFVSKAEVADWPVIGSLAKLGDTVFIDRRRSQAHAAKQDMTKRISHQTHAGLMVFFPEATSGDGNRLLPFKSALFAVADSLDEDQTPDQTQDQGITVQPAAIAYTRLNGLPTGIGWRSFFSWYGDMPLGAHAWKFLQLGQATVEIVFLPPLNRHQNPNRKALAQACELAVQDGFNALLTGRRFD